ncbi:MAG: TIGR02147 family protein [Bdellovibrionales bacterium]|nr:TIGR02147 family protein [Bdellovibrionales bacterium]
MDTPLSKGAEPSEKIVTPPLQQSEDSKKSPESSGTKAQSPDVTGYLNYREYLKDFFAYKKSTNSNYSHRLFMQKAGLSSPGHLKMVIDGKRNLTHLTLPKYIAAVGLTRKKDIKYFELLVRYNQCDEPIEKIKFFNELMSEKKKKGLSILEKHQFDFLSNWLHVAIYVMAGLRDFKADAEWITNRMRKRVSKLHVEAALEDLMELGLIELRGNRYEQVQGALTIPDEVQSTAIHMFHEKMLQMALFALREYDVAEREFNSVTFSFKKSELMTIKNRIREFRREINEFSSNAPDSDEVYQLNIQLLPLTKGDRP